MSKVISNNVALYCRLSREDGDSAESSSITNQKEMLVEFANNNNWNIFDTYVDDGYSGGNFNRPGFQRLIQDIEDGKINIVITKDLSRLGRNYIQVGYYTEEFFPEHNVRYIAINDNFDSTNEEDDFTPFKNIINQWYLKDISKKIRSSINVRMKQGKLPTNLKLPLYGYQPDEENGRIIDLETAPVVKRIFDLYKNGMLIYQIANLLTKEKVYTPKYYAYLKYGFNPTKWIDAPEEEKYNWSKTTVNQILSNEGYVGTLILKQNKTISYKTHKRVKTEKDEQYVFKNKYEPIIDNDLFNEVQLLRKIKTKSKIPSEENLLGNILICGGCGNALTLIKRKNSVGQPTDYYYCRCSSCKEHGYIGKEYITELIENDIKILTSILLEHEKQLLDYSMGYKQNGKNFSNNYQKELNKLNKRNNELSNLIKKLFESSIVGDLPPDIYKKMLATYKAELDENNAKISLYYKILNDNKAIDYSKKSNEFINNLKNISEPLTKEKLSCIISKVTIHKHKKINISYYQIDDMIKQFISEEI